jgi:hypothetical protein
MIRDPLALSLTIKAAFIDTNFVSRISEILSEPMASRLLH